MPKWLIKAGLASMVAGLGLALASCSSPDPGDGTSLTVIDVRTAEEYAEGHLKGALNIDVQLPDFPAQISALDKEGSYLVYCWAGNRSWAAYEYMTEVGFTDVTDGGDMQNAAKTTGLAIVQ
ncbi:MAG: rhodanese-like domain-containing protein [Micrococcales bacterium]|nr:rhodanese-like domain-containing protein [Micrococcales bacterium]